ncbi:MAG: AMP-binding protein, partial [Bdellovibrionales bacterium]|nr:AMP-binding protein [Bdellovibrionales bacterium]NQZ19947.1 AMP-binding protein [Bdellovibrionales bacterium]
MTLLTRFLENVKRRPQHEAINYFSKGHKFAYTWQQAYDFIENYFHGLVNLGIQKGDSVAIYSNTCKEWGLLDLSIMSIGAKTVPLYHSSPVEDAQYILEHCEAKIVVVENETLYKRLKETSAYPDLKKIIIINEFEVDDNKCVSLKDIITDKEKISLQQSIRSVKIHDDATVIYTSGTSGTPKGVLLTHEQILSSVAEVFPLLGVTHNDRTLTFLPFSHVLGRMELWGSYFCGYTVGYAESIEKIKKNLPVIKPT